MSWWKYAKAGDKLVCVDDKWVFQGKPSLNETPKEGEIVTIVSIGEHPTASWNGCTFFVTICEYKWAKSCLNFRPVQTRSTETGMSILKSLLTGADIKGGVES
jgi:hypothetical protein